MSEEQKEYTFVYRGNEPAYAMVLMSAFPGRSTAITAMSGMMERIKQNLKRITDAGFLPPEVTVVEHFEDTGVMKIKGPAEVVAKLRRFVEEHRLGYVAEVAPPPPPVRTSIP